MDNINKLLEILIQNSKEIFQNCIEESFDYLIQYYLENRVHIEGWKINERWKVGKKFILLNMIDWIDLKYLKTDTINCLDYTKGENIRYLEKVLCNLVGRDISRVLTVEYIVNNGIEFRKWNNLEFFKFKVFKKGTIHFEFLNEKIWNEFNRIPCEGKKWLGY